MGQALLLTGRPGVGKTTAIRRVVDRLPAAAAGFYTQEIRRDGIRLGFEIVTLSGRQAVLAHVDLPKRQRVGRYGVDTGALVQIGVAAIRQGLASGQLVVIDEIGPMELLSPEFRRAVLEALASPSPVLGTILSRPHPFGDRIKAMPQVSLLTVTLDNRDGLAGQILNRLHLG
jgi:nucleoside-triphosphatase